MSLYAVRFGRGAARALAEVLPAAVAFAVQEFAAGPLAENPHRVGKRLREPKAHLHSARRGTFRILYEINDESRTVIVEAVAHRSDVYRARRPDHGGGCAVPGRPRRGGFGGGAVMESRGAGRSGGRASLRR
ncbi:type II toxin-antitoxin system RelE/ParE family toxin [Actinoplanes sp. NPDC051494]|uniref:type II toxin-antitoxin system RelE/ParE family toxin n=1 Tax=Actinoplanes sp. NPDC051494 TaxID=3363907 RepID=UPI003789446F